MKKQTIAFVRDDLTGLRMLNREHFLAFLSDFGAGTKLRLEISNYFPQRSLKQNSLLHFYAELLADECGMQTDDFKMMMKMKFLTKAATDRNGEYIMDRETGEVMTYIPSTADLDTKEFGEFIDNIRVFGQEHLNYSLPEPDANYKIHFLEEHKETLKNK